MARPNSDRFERGSIVDGRYEILETIGSGAMGVVYRARDRAVGRDVAIKTLNMRAAKNEVWVARFAREAQIMASLGHPNTVHLFDFGRTEDGRAFAVMELLVGRTLTCLLDQGPVDRQRAIRILRQVALSLDEAHRKGIVHRDLKPANIFIQQKGEHEVVKVLDFGIAKVDDARPLTAVGMVFGTPAYMSPEQIQCAPIGPRSDLYSLGIIAYECFAGRRPFHSNSAQDLMLRHMHMVPQPLSELALAASVDDALERLVLGLLEKDPDARPQSAADVAARLDEIAAASAKIVEHRPQRAANAIRGRAPLSVDPRPQDEPEAASWIHVLLEKLFSLLGRGSVQST